MDDKTTLLIIEDDDVDVEALTRGINARGIGYDIRTGHDGVEAMAILNEITSNPMNKCLVVLDLNMPGMNGLQFLAELRKNEQTKRTLVFVFTTSDREQDKLAAYDLNVAGYFLKSNFDGMLDTLSAYTENVRYPTKAVSTAFSNTAS